MLPPHSLPGATQSAARWSPTVHSVGPEKMISMAVTGPVNQKLQGHRQPETLQGRLEA